ncbi:MAG: TRAP transporter large permease subunit [Gammaproteobacteria bacterium]|nr:TRAP transporter large permease subunit [Gammaproteobacteria bacterium]NNJ50023.1 TRAP transporter large permease subunit [Gammaproteobacteria bacterium]
MIAATILLIVIALVGAPLFTVIAAGAILASFSADISPDIIIIEMHRLAASPNMIAIPLFTFAGVLMSSGGAPRRLVDFYRAAFGWMPGGLAIVTIGACAFFTTFSGASGVTILALGGLLYPILRGEGYKENFSLGLLTTSGSLGLLFPPSLAILVYGIVAGVSIEKMFFAGLVPGVLLILMLSAYSMVHGNRSHVVRHKFDINTLLTAAKGSAWDLFLPAGVVIGIFGGFVSIMEAAAVTAAYVIIVEVFIYREIDLRTQFFGLLVETCVLFGSLLAILLVALGMTNLMIDAQLPMKLLAAIEDHITSPLEFLLLLNLFLLLVGAMMDIFSAIIVVVPLILPLASRYGVDPIHLGIIFLANLEIGYSTPPVGINLFIASQRFNKTIVTLFKSTLPYLLIMLIWLLMITYIPELSLWWK